MNTGKRNPGTLIQLQDGRIAVVYNYQPLLKIKKVVFHLLDENFKPIMNGDKQKTLVWDLDAYNKAAKEKTIKGIGKID
jgi:hypothetical protein